MAVLEYESSTQYQIRIRFTSKVYTATSVINGDDTITQINIDSTSALMSGNPVGIITPNNLSVTIRVNDFEILPDGSQTVVGETLTQGLKMSLYSRTTPESSWVKQLDYYTNDFEIEKSNGAYGVMSLNGVDRLTYISNRALPKMKSSRNIYATAQIRKLLKACGVASSDIIISPELDNKVEIAYDKSKGTKVLEVLNTLTQALIARIGVTSENKIEVLPAFPQVPSNVDEISTKGLTVASQSNNPLGMYGKVRLEYSDVSNEPTQVIYTNNNIRVKEGNNFYDNLKANGTILAIDDVSISHVASENDVMIDDIRYDTNQNEMDITVVNGGKAFRGEMVITGRVTTNSGTYISKRVYENIRANDVELTITNTNIQDKDTASSYVDDVIEYLKKINGVVTLTGYFNPNIVENKYYRIRSTDKLVGGLYMVVERHTVISFNQTGTLKLIKVGGV